MAPLRNVYRQFYNPSDDEFAELWNDGTFYFDASSLLTLYRLTATSREKLLQAIEAIKPRARLPYQAGLEFFDHRPKQVIESNARYDRVQKVVSDGLDRIFQEIEAIETRTSEQLIDIDPFRANCEAGKKDFDVLVDQERAEMTVNLAADPILDRLEAVFDGRVTSKPGQEWLEAANLEAERRFERNIPPGYADAAKIGIRFDGQNEYERKYGDYYIWRQLCEDAKSGKLKQVALISDDRKDDWYQKVKVSGRAEVVSGPRTELRAEASTYGINLFHLYSSERFLKYASDRFDLKAASSELDEIRDAGAEAREQTYRVRADRRVLAGQAVARWARQSSTADVVTTNSGFPTLQVETRSGDEWAIDVKYLHNPRAYHIYPILVHEFQRGDDALLWEDYRYFVVCLVADSERGAAEIAAGVRLTSRKVIVKHMVWVGYLNQDDVKPDFQRTHSFKSGYRDDQESLELGI